MIFGNWRITNKQPHVESEEVKELHALLAAQKKVSDREAQKSAENTKALKDMLDGNDLGDNDG